MKAANAFLLMLVAMCCLIACTESRGVFYSHKNLMTRKLLTLFRGSCSTENDCVSRFQPTRCCARRINTAADGEAVTFNRFGRCVGLAQVQSSADFTLNRIDDDLAGAASVAEALARLSANQDFLLICPSGSLGAVSAPARKKRQAISPQASAADLVNAVSAPDVATVDMVDATTVPPTTTTSDATTVPITFATFRDIVKVEPVKTVESIGLFRRDAEKAEHLLGDLVGEIDEMQG